MTVALRAHPLPVERAKYLAPQASPALQRAREQTAIVLSLALCEKEAAIAAGFGVSPRAVSRWLNPEMSDVRPAPLALLLAVDDTQFERVVGMLRAARSATKGG